MTRGKSRGPSERFGIGELFGRLVDCVSEEERNSLIQHSGSSALSEYPECPFRIPSMAGSRRCSKKGGVCSMRKYKNADGIAERLPAPAGSLTVMCPFRFHESLEVFSWVGEKVLGQQDPAKIVIPREVGFLQSINAGNAEISGAENQDSDDVGKIDMILVDKDSIGSSHLQWCAMEIQAVYFSGEAMGSEFQAIKNHVGPGIPFPNKNRRPDYRSSGPKRLMPQLQTKIPSLRRWGKKMGVVVDRPFYEWLAAMEAVNDISNSDIIWFVMDYEENLETATARLIRNKTHFTTLERAIDGLTGGLPVSLSEFETRILAKIALESQRG